MNRSTSGEHSTLPQVSTAVNEPRYQQESADIWLQLKNPTPQSTKSQECFRFRAQHSDREQKERNRQKSYAGASGERKWLPVTHFTIR